MLLGDPRSIVRPEARLPVLDGMRHRDGRRVRRCGMQDVVPRQDEVGIDLAGDGKQREEEDDDHGFHGALIALNWG
jgi:hypothetical protein